MGLFDLFRSKPTYFEEDHDRGWVKRETMLRGICQEVGKRLQRDSCVVIVVHFPVGFLDLQEELQKASVETRVWGKSIEPATLLTSLDSDVPTASLIPAPGLVSHGPPVEVTAKDNSKCVSILVLGRHPLWSANRAILDFAARIPQRVRIGFYLSLDDPVIRNVVGSRVLDFIMRFVQDDSQELPGRDIGPILERAAKKFEQKATSNLAADSAEEWFELNAPK